MPPDPVEPMIHSVALLGRQLAPYKLLTPIEEQQVAKAVVACRRELYEALFSLMPVARNAFNLMNEVPTEGAINQNSRIVHISTVDPPEFKRAVLRLLVGNIQTVRALFERLAKNGLVEGEPTQPHLDTAQCDENAERLRQKISRLLAEVPIRPAFREEFLSQSKEYVMTARSLYSKVKRCRDPLQRETHADALREHLEVSGESYQSLNGKWQRVCCAHQDYLTAKEILVTRNIRLAFNQAKRFVDRGVSIEDLIQEGVGGLMTAVEKYDPSRGWRFSTYATPWVRQTMFRVIETSARTIRIPGPTLNMVRKVDTFATDFQRREGRSPTPEEIESAFKGRKLPFAITAKWVREMRLLSLPVVSIEGGKSEEPAHGGWMNTLVDTGEAPSEVVEREMDAQRRKDDIARVFREELTPRQQQVMRLRFGLDGGGELTLREIGERLGVCRERIRQIEAKATEVLEGSDLARVYGRSGGS